jgi:hypothetical protein
MGKIAGDFPIPGRNRGSESFIEKNGLRPFFRVVLAACRVA